MLDRAFGVESGAVTTMHASMNDQSVIDAYHPDLRRARAANVSIIPVDTAGRRHPARAAAELEAASRPSPCAYPPSTSPPWTWR